MVIPLPAFPILFFRNSDPKPLGLPKLYNRCSSNFCPSTLACAVFPLDFPPLLSRWSLEDVIYASFHAHFLPRALMTTSGLFALSSVFLQHQLAVTITFNDVAAVNDYILYNHYIFINDYNHYIFINRWLTCLKSGVFPFRVLTHLCS